MPEFTAVTGWTIHKVAAHPGTAFKQMEALWEQRNRLMDAKALQEAPQADLPPFPAYDKPASEWAHVCRREDF